MVLFLLLISHKQVVNAVLSAITPFPAPHLGECKSLFILVRICNMGNESAV